MKLIQYALLAALAAPVSIAHADATEACAHAFDAAQQEKIIVTSAQANRVVAGPGRLFFHSAPDDRCRLKNVFVIPRDQLEVFADHGAYTEVIYWNPVTGSGTAGWVLSARLAEVREMVGLVSKREQ